MRATLIRALDRVRNSYWFVPAVMALGAMLLAFTMVYVDSHIGAEWMDRLPWLYAARPDGARSLLSAVGGSMIGVAGTTFSVTIAAVVYASGQYGPRLLSNFMADRGNQVTLGTFIATFVYSLIVLRTIRSPGESGGAAFVPQLALVVAVVLVGASIAVLIFFIHHVPQRIHINSVIERIGERLIGEIDRRFPVTIGAPLDTVDDESSIPVAMRVGAAPSDERRAISACDNGYIQVIDDDTLLSIAGKHDLILRVQYQPGDFARVGSELVHVWPADRCDDAIADELRGAFALGSRRTPLQDMRFLVDELVEIAARALSPGVNDPFTANSCYDWLGAAMADLAGRKLPSRLRADADGSLRVIAHPVAFSRYIDRSFGALAQYASGDAIAAQHALAVLGDLALACEEERIEPVRRQIQRIGALAGEALNGPSLTDVQSRVETLLRRIDDPQTLRRLADRPGWLAGSA